MLNSYNSPRTSGFENLFRNGVFLYAQAAQKTGFFGLPGRQVFAGLFGTGSFSDLSPASFIELPVGAAFAPKKQGTWTLLWNAEQRLWVDPNDPDRGLGLYVQTGLGDGNPNPVRGFLSIARSAGTARCRAARGIPTARGSTISGPARWPSSRCRGCGTNRGSSSSTTCGSRQAATSPRTCSFCIRDWRR